MDFRRQGPFLLALRLVLILAPFYRLFLLRSLLLLALVLILLSTFVSHCPILSRAENRSETSNAIVRAGGRIQ